MNQNLPEALDGLLASIAHMRAAIVETYQRQQRRTCSAIACAETEHALPEFLHAVDEIAAVLAQIKASAELAEIVKVVLQAEHAHSGSFPAAAQVMGSALCEGFSALQWAQLSLATLDRAGVDAKTQRVIRAQILTALFGVSA